MVFVDRVMILYFFTVAIVAVTGQSKCEDYSPDPANCTRFIRCFHNLRIKFTCPPGTAWENTLKTCAWREYVEGCEQDSPAKELHLGNDTGADDDIETYEADPDTLAEIPIGQTLAQARALGPMATPKQYRCTYCTIGMCTPTSTVMQCYCGTATCPPSTPPQQRSPCDQNPCLNGGRCMTNGMGFICQCPSAFVGDRCEAPAFTPCQPNPCLNGGVCTPQGSSFRCRCQAGYMGICCETRIPTTPAFNPCSPSPCLNGGTCIPRGVTFLCQCPSTYIGRCCETRLTTTTPYNPCLQAPCRNGARCIPAGSSYLCQCPSGFYGTRCEIQNYCMPNPCMNGGFCQQTTTGYICSCSYPYTGTNCQSMITTTALATNAMPTRAPCGPSCGCVMTPCPMVVVMNPCMPNPCANAGGCMAQNFGAQCFCPSYYTGYYCQYARSSRSLVSKACNKTCLNGGKCYIDERNGGQARCSCSNEYYGTQCEKMNRPKSCSPKNPCLNKAKCVTTTSGSKCVCAKGTSGVLCERVHRSNPRSFCPLNCQAGGTCIYVRTKAQCRCPKGRTGRLCELSSGKTLSNEEDEIEMPEFIDDEE